MEHDKSIHLEQIMRKIKEETERIKNTTPPTYPQTALRSSHYTDTYLYEELDNTFSLKNYYYTNDFLSYADEPFIKYIFKALFFRDPLTSELAHHVNNLRSMTTGKLEMLWNLWNASGKNVVIKDLKKKIYINKIKKLFLHKIPVIRYLFKIGYGILTLPRLAQAHQRLEVHFNATYTELRKQIFSMLADYSNKLANEINKLANEINKLANDVSALQIGSESHFANYQKMSERITDLTMSLTNQQRIFAHFIDEAKNMKNECADTSLAVSLNQGSAHLYDSFYVSFENRFRGTTQDIKNRLMVYLPYLDKINDIKNYPVLDIGCGRGEWLELLKENDYQATGIDLNAIMVDECVKSGLDVQFIDAIAFLREQQDNTFAAITGFHIVEHLDFNSLISLFDESLRVLKPGGMLIFETPNPENIIVGACSFYTDPTHVHPIPPDTLKFIAEQRGAMNVNIVRLHKINEIETTGNRLLDDVLTRMNMEQDYSIIGYKQ